MNKSELKQKWYYRMSKVIAIVILLLTFIGPFYQKRSPEPFIDAISGVFINGLIIFIVWEIVKYIAWGKVEHEIQTKKNSKEVKFVFREFLGFFGKLVLASIMITSIIILIAFSVSKL
jgi:hypothetical protein